MAIKTSVFHVDVKADLENLWQELEESGCELLYSDSDESAQKIFGHLPKGLNKKKITEEYPQILAIEDIELPDIDWEAQWAAHENYQEGYLHVDLKDYAENSLFTEWSPLLKLIPGPGFGDLSHPTTRLVLKLMPAFVNHQHVVDIGCGSGILSLAAIAMGAKDVVGIDIDEQAIFHSKENCEKNGMNENMRFVLPQDSSLINESSVVLMNMIHSEQLVAWESFHSRKKSVSFVITSGILKEGRDDYLKQCKAWKWNLIKEKEEEGWLGFIFKSV